MTIASEHGAHSSFVVEWRLGFRTGIERVDAEHEHLFGLVKALDLQNAQQAVYGLVDYVVTHFSHEQALMEEIGYPDLPAHIAMHAALGARVSEILDDDSPWTEQRVQALRKFLNAWLVDHILTEDLRFGKWYVAHAKLQAAAPAPAPAPAPGQARSSWLAWLLGRR